MTTNRANIWTGLRELQKHLAWQLTRLEGSDPQFATAIEEIQGILAAGLLSLGGLCGVPVEEDEFFLDYARETERLRREGSVPAAARCGLARSSHEKTRLAVV